MKAGIENLLCVEIEINTRCNRSCSYCPVSILPPPSANNNMPWSIYERIVLQLEGIHYDGRISFHLYSEPLLRKDLHKFVSYAKSRLPRCSIVLFTNGDLLTEEKYQTLMKAGVDTIVITAHSGAVHPDRPRQIVQYPSDLELTNRGGVIPLPTAQEMLAVPCFAPGEMLIITVNGDVLLCYEDARREVTLGNIVAETLFDIWSSETRVAICAALESGQREKASPICMVCNNQAHAVPGKSAASERFWVDREGRDGSGLRP